MKKGSRESYSDDSSLLDGLGCARRCSACLNSACLNFLNSLTACLSPEMHAYRLFVAAFGGWQLA